MAALSAAEPPRKDARIGGIDAEVTRIELPFAYVTVDDLDDEAGAEGCELVETACAVDDEGPPGSELGERLGVRRCEFRANRRRRPRRRPRRGWRAGRGR